MGLSCGPYLSQAEVSETCSQHRSNLSRLGAVSFDLLHVYKTFYMCEVMFSGIF